MKHDLSHVYWIGGSGCSGKSTIAKILAEDYGFTTYHCDEHWGEHQDRCTPAEHPATLRVRGGDIEEFFRLPPREFVEASTAWWREDFSMILDDLHAMPDEKIVVEGVSLEPEFVLDVADSQRMIFMIAFEEFQREHYLTRDWARDFFQALADPEGAFESFMGNLGFQTRSLFERASELGLKVLVTDEKSTLAGSLEFVTEHFRL